MKQLATEAMEKVAILAMVTEVRQDPEVNTIVCYDYDRFSRNASEGIMWKTKLKSEGITLIAINQPISQDNFFAESIENMMIVVANMDNAARKAELTREAAGLNEELSNLAEYVSTTVSMSSQLGTWWSQNDFDTCQNVQKLVHPLGIYWDNEKKCYLTPKENQALVLFRSISDSCRGAKKKKRKNLSIFPW